MAFLLPAPTGFAFRLTGEPLMIDCIDGRYFRLTDELCYVIIYISIKLSEGCMNSNYVIKMVSIGSDNEKTYEPGFAVHEGDVILDKGFRFTVLPGRLDLSKPVRKNL